MKILALTTSYRKQGATARIVRMMQPSERETTKTGLPVTRDLAQAYAFSLLVALVMAAASVLGLLCPTQLYPTEERQHSLLTNDLVNLCSGAGSSR